MNYTVKQNDSLVKVFSAKIKPKPYNEVLNQEFVSLVFEKEVVLNIESKIKIEELKIRPLKYGIDYTYTEHSISISIDKPCNFSVEINNSLSDNLLVFVSPKRDTTFEGKKLISITEDKTIDRLSIKEDNCVLRIEDGVVLNTKVEANNCKNLHICGNGILTLSDVEDWNQRICLDVLGCENVLIEDIIVTESLFWCIRLLGCDNVEIRNVKIIGYRGNNDGIDVCGSRHVKVSDCFIRTTDDCLVVKAVDERDKKSIHYVVEGSGIDIEPAFEKVGDVYDVSFSNCVLWNDFARPIEIGVSLRADSVHDISYRDIYILHSTTGYPLMGAHHGDRADVHDISFENIYIEDTPGAQLFDFRITNSDWSTDDKKGKIHDVHFKNVNIIGEQSFGLEASRLEGFSEDHNLYNFTFENFVFNNKAVNDLAGLNLDVRDYVDNVSVVNTTNLPKGESVLTQLKVLEPFVRGTNGCWSGKVICKVINNTTNSQKGDLEIKLAPRNCGKLVGPPFTYDLQPGEECELSVLCELNPGKILLCVNSSDLMIKGDWLLLEHPWIVSKDINQNGIAFGNYYGDERSPVFIAVEDEDLVVKSELIKNAMVTMYTASDVQFREGDVVFTSEETDFGETKALVKSGNKLISAPQLRCPAEMTYVFHNEPIATNFNSTKIENSDDGEFRIKLSELGIDKNSKTFFVEFLVEDDELKKYRYGMTLFRSVWPECLFHMFGKVIIE